MSPSAQLELVTDREDFFGDFRESHTVTAHILGDPTKPHKITAEIDIGSGSVKLAIYRHTDDGFEDITKQVFVKFNSERAGTNIPPSDQCKLGRGAVPNNIRNASLNDEGIAMALPLLRNFMRVIHTLNGPVCIKIAATAIVRNSLKNLSPEGRPKTVQFLREVENITGFKPSIMSEQAEIEHSLAGILLKGASQKDQTHRPSKGVMYYGGGNTIQVAEFRNDLIVGHHASVLQIGTRSLEGRKDVNELIDDAVRIAAPWLHPSRLRETDGVFGGGMFRLPGRVLALLMQGVDPATEHMHLDGYSFSFQTKKELQRIRTHLCDMKKMTADELFKRATGKTKSEFNQDIKHAEGQIHGLTFVKSAIHDLDDDVAAKLFPRQGSSPESFIKTVDDVIEETDCVKTSSATLTIAQAKRLVTRWGSKVEKRLSDLPNDAQLVLNHLNRMYGERGERLADREHSITFSGGNTRLAMAANGLH